MRYLTATTIVAACVAALLACRSDAQAMGMGGAGVPFPGVAVTSPPLDPAYPPAPPAGVYCATPTHLCQLHRTGYVGDPCSCRARGGSREPGHVVQQ